MPPIAAKWFEYSKDDQVSPPWCLTHPIRALWLFDVYQQTQNDDPVHYLCRNYAISGVVIPAKAGIHLVYQSGFPPARE